MQHAVSMRVVESIADLAGVVERNRHVERAAPREHHFERLAGHVLHHDEEDVLLLIRRHERDDVRVVQAAEQLGFANQFAEVDALLVGNLERNLLIDPGVFGEVDRAEAAAADRGEDLVLADDLVAEEHSTA